MSDLASPSLLDADVPLQLTEGRIVRSIAFSRTPANSSQPLSNSDCRESTPVTSEYSVRERHRTHHVISHDPEQLPPNQSILIYHSGSISQVLSELLK
jgi:hypothetical protein